MSFFRRGGGDALKERARAKPGASPFGPRLSFSTHLEQAVTSVFPVWTRRTLTLTAPHNSHSPMQRSGDDDICSL